MGGGIGFGSYDSSDSSLIPSHFRHLEISNNAADFAGGGICLQNGFPVIFEDFVFENNSAVYYGGGFYLEQSPVSMIRGKIKGNILNGSAASENDFGGGFYLDNLNTTYSIALESLIFNDNKAKYGAAISIVNFSVFATNITFADNVASISGNVAHCWDNTIFSLKNSIIKNSANGLQAMSLFPNSTSANSNYTIEHSIVNDTFLPCFTILNDVHLDTEPGFVDAANGNYHLLACSPAVDVGVNAFVTYSPTQDAATDPRIKNNIVDLGAYEYQYIDLAYMQQPSDITVPVGATAQFDVTAQNTDANYQWQVSQDGGLTWSNLLGTTSSNLILNSVTTAMNGYLYRCIISHCGGTLSSNAGMLTVSGIMGIDQHLLDGLVLYPNPSKEHFIIRYNAVTSDGDIIVYDVQGREIYQENIKAASLQQGAVVKISEWQDGLYWIKLHIDNQDIIIKFIKG